MADLSSLPKDKRTCWECNPSHERLKDCSEVLRCIICWRRFKDGKFLDTQKRRAR